MQSIWRRGARVTVLALITGLAVALATGGVAEAKKKKKKSPTANVTVQLNQVVPASSMGPPFHNGELASTTTLGKKFKGQLVGDVNARFTANGGDVAGLAVRLSAPDGSTTCLLGCQFGLSGPQIGPLTLDDQTPVILVGGDPSGSNQLGPPYGGTAEPEGQMSSLNGGAAKGTWTLWADNADPFNQVTIASWGIQVRTHRPYLTK